jgi:hypothetical protein
MTYPKAFSFLEKKPSSAIISAVSLLISFGFFAWFILEKRVMEPDLREHLKLSHQLISGELIIGHPTFFFLIQLLSGFTQNLVAEMFAVWLIFSISQYLKIRLSFDFLKDIFKNEANWLVFVLVLAIQFVIPNTLFTRHYIINNISPNYFHNGTLLLVWPLVLLFFRHTLLFLEDGKRKRLFYMGGLGLLMITIKPSFLFCWIPVMPVYIFMKEKWSPKLKQILVLIFIFLAAVWLQNLWLRQSALVFKIVFEPFFFFGSWQNHVLVILSGLSFPIALFLAGFRDWVAEKRNLLLFLFFIQGLVLSFCFYDVIRGYISPNMTWQSSMVAYLWFLFAINFTEKLWKSGRWLYSLVPLLFLAMHLLSSARYLYMVSHIRSFFL